MIKMNQTFIMMTCGTVNVYPYVNINIIDFFVHLHTKQTINVQTNVR